jgi:hypothetical protein
MRDVVRPRRAVDEIATAAAPGAPFEQWNPVVVRDTAFVLVSIMPMLLLLGLILSMWSASAGAFDLQRAEAQFVDGEYRFEMTAVLEAPVAAVERILRDYENYTTLDSRILEARVLDRPDAASAILATTLRACFGPVCRTVKRVERVEESPRALLALTDVSRSDMKFGETRMELSSVEPHRTQVVYRTRLKPAFWIPALVARRMMLETLEDATIELFQNVEKQATVEDAP